MTAHILRQGLDSPSTSGMLQLESKCCVCLLVSLIESRAQV